MSSSGLIYAVIVGAWAAYLVPMWLRRQDELNESRPTERFSTAIRLLAGRSAMERRASRTLGEPTRDHNTPTEPEPAGDSASTPEPEPEPSLDPAGEPEPSPAQPSPAQPAPARAEERREAPRHSSERRARLLARRRRMVTFLFLAFAGGAIAAAVAGIAFIWVPAIPAVLLTFYIGHLRRLERQRYEVKLDRDRAAQAAERLRARERERDRHQESGPAAQPVPHDAAHPGDAGRPHLRLAAEPGAHGVRSDSAAEVLADATEHEEWVDGMRERSAAGPDSWEPVPVPLPTYVTAPVAPRTTRNLDLASPGTWDSGRPTPDARKTPLFDQYADHAPPPAEDDYVTRPRAANE